MVMGMFLSKSAPSSRAKNIADTLLRLQDSFCYQYDKTRNIWKNATCIFIFLLLLKVIFEKDNIMYESIGIWILSIFMAIFKFNYLLFIKYNIRIIHLVLNLFGHSQFFEIQKKIPFFSCFPRIFLKKEPKTRRKSENNDKSSCFSFCRLLCLKIVAVIFIVHSYISNQNGTKHQISVLDTFTKFFDKMKFTPFVHNIKHNNIVLSVAYGCQFENVSQGRSYYRNKVNVSDCFFSRSSQYSGKGGVIYVDEGFFSMNIEYSMFYFCCCSEDGGAIYFYSQVSNLRMICAHMCSCGLFGRYNFAYLRASHVNQMEYQSISYCSYILIGTFSIIFIDGNQRFVNTNSSMNKGYECIIAFAAPFSYSSLHCTFSNNLVSNSNCILFYSESGTISMSFANIVHNNSPHDGVVTVGGEGSRNMMYCIFHNNQNYLFCVFSGSLEVSHSFIDHSSSSVSSNISVSTATNNSFINRMTYQIQFFNSLHCNADIPFTGFSLTPTQVTTEHPKQTNSTFDSFIQSYVGKISAYGTALITFLTSVIVCIKKVCCKEDNSDSDDPNNPPQINIYFDGVKMNSKAQINMGSVTRP